MGWYNYGNISWKSCSKISLYHLENDIKFISFYSEMAKESHVMYIQHYVRLALAVLNIYPVHAYETP